MANYTLLKNLLLGETKEMSSQANAKKVNFILLAYRTLARCSSICCAYIEAQITSFAHDGEACKLGYTGFAQRLYMSKATVARAMAEIKERDYIEAERHGGKCTTYTTTFDYLDGAYITLPTFLMDEIVITYRPRAKGERGKRRFGRSATAVTVKVKLKRSEQLVLALIYTLTKALKEDEDDVETSPALLCAKLQGILCERSVASALLRLENLGLIIQTRVSVNGHIKGGYRADMKKFREVSNATKRAKRKEEKEKKRLENQLQAANEKIEKLINEPWSRAEAKKEAEIKALNAKAERERYYTSRHNDALNAAEDYKRSAFKIAEFASISKELKDVDDKLVDAMMRKNDAEEQALKRREAELKGTRAALIKRFGIIPERFHARYYYGCECDKEGILPNGKWCTCWLERRQT